MGLQRDVSRNQQCCALRRQRPHVNHIGTFWLLTAKLIALQDGRASIVHPQMLQVVILVNNCQQGSVELVSLCVVVNGHHSIHTVDVGRQDRAMVVTLNHGPQSLKHRSSGKLVAPAAKRQQLQNQGVVNRVTLITVELTQFHLVQIGQHSVIEVIWLNTEKQASNRQ